MFDFLLTSLPRELVIEIVLFEGRVMRAYLRDYVSQVYTRHYKAYFGYKHCLKYITGGYSCRDNMASLPYYAAWSTLIREKHPHFVKARLPHKHMRPFKKHLFPGLDSRKNGYCWRLRWRDISIRRPERPSTRSNFRDRIPFRFRRISGFRISRKRF